MLVPIPATGLQSSRVVGHVEKPVADRLRLIARLSGLSVPGAVAQALEAFIEARQAELSERGVFLE